MNQYNTANRRFSSLTRVVCAVASSEPIFSDVARDTLTAVFNTSLFVTRRNIWYDRREYKYPIVERVESNLRRDVYGRPSDSPARTSSRVT